MWFATAGGGLKAGAINGSFMTRAVSYELEWARIDFIKDIGLERHLWALILWFDEVAKELW